MSLFTIDKSKCKKDGICAIDCPLGIISFDNDYPFTTAEAEKGCINCGHCLAICPHEALSLSKMPLENCQPFRPELIPSFEQVEAFLKGCRSVRHFQNKKVDKSDIEKAIDIARHASSAGNMQPVKWNVIYDSNKVKDVAKTVIEWMRSSMKVQSQHVMAPYFERMVNAWDRGKDPVCRNAPHLVITYSQENNLVAQNDSTIALTHFALSAMSLNIGTCWVGFIMMATRNSTELDKVLNIPAGYKCTGAMMMGIPKYRYHRIPMRNKADISWS